MKKTTTKMSGLRRGSAIIVAILVMAVLLTLTLGLSMLTVFEIRQTGDFVAAGKAYYAAEAGIENALLDLHEHLPGYQTKNLPNSDKEGWISKELEDPAFMTEEKLSYRYRIRNQGDRYPYFDDDKPIFLTPGVGITKKALYEQHPAATYNILPLNQTVTIPLFVDCGDGVNYKDVKNFILQYYVDFDADPENMLQLGSKIQDFDVLRWKLFGEPKDSGAIARTHAISDFYPAHESDGPEKPVCIGSDISLAAENCIIPVAQHADNFENVAASWSVARECYQSDAGSAVAATSIQKGCNIATFMQHHRKNYLTITNVVNPDIIGITDPVRRAEKANIYYRVIAEKDPLQACPGETAENKDVIVREYAEISADGYALGGKVKQSIDARLRLNSFLPVFNFTLYRTNPDVQNVEEQEAELPFFGSR